MPNLYLVISEELSEIVWEDWFNEVGHAETYRIAELVIAENRGQAKWLAWKIDRDSFTGHVRDLPRFKIALQRKEERGPVRIATKEIPADDPVWVFPGFPWGDSRC